MGLMIGRERDLSRVVVVVVAVAMGVVTLLDLAFPQLHLLPFMVPAIAVAALLAPPRAVAILAGAGVVLTVVVSIVHGDFDTTDGWLNLVGMIIGAVLVVLISAGMTHWRQRAKQREEQYRMLAENASDIVARVAPDGTIEWVSPSVTAVLGLDADSLLGTAPWDLLHPDDLKPAMVGLAEAARGSDRPEPLAARFRTHDGDYIWMSAGARPLPGGAFAVSFRVVDAEIRAVAALAESEARYRLLAENTMDMVVSLDMHAVVQWVSPSATSMLGYQPHELIGVHGGVLINDVDLPLLLDASAKARRGVPTSCAIRLVGKDGSNRWVEATPRGLYDEGVLVGGVIGVRDIQGEVEARAALDHEVQYDSLTGLAGRTLALHRIDGILDGRGDRPWALLCVGIDGLTAINQAYTYAVGDLVLSTVSERLVAVTGAPARVARITGDEFAVLIEDLESPSDAADAADRILVAVRGSVPVDVPGVEVSEVDVTACVGVAMAGGVDAQELLRDSTAAMRQAGRTGPDRWEFLDGDVGQGARDALTVQSALREALALGLVVPWLMPITSFARSKAVGYEALVRWVQSDGTVIPPSHFLDIAERSGLIVAIDRAILGGALDAVGSLPGGTTMAVNVSAATMSSGSLENWVRAELERTGVDPHRLHLEVTETSILHVTGDVRATMASLVDLGVAWWVDDFGTGYSSISHLRDLPVAGLKLDREFTSGVSYEDSRATRLALGLAGLADGLELHTIAEGVETPEQAQVLASQGWEMGQGWLYGKAVPLSELATEAG